MWRVLPHPAKGNKVPVSEYHEYPGSRGVALRPDSYRVVPESNIQRGRKVKIERSSLRRLYQNIFRLFERSPDSHPYKSERNRSDAEFATSHAKG
jgi:hypothetical protein